MNEKEHIGLYLFAMVGTISLLTGENNETHRLTTSGLPTGQNVHAADFSKAEICFSASRKHRSGSKTIPIPMTVSFVQI